MRKIIIIMPVLALYLNATNYVPGDKFCENHPTSPLCQVSNPVECEPCKDGTNGDSAYQVAQDNGFNGTESEWLDSLNGTDGTSVKGDKGDSITGATGSNGLSNYELAQNNGFSGTEAEYLDSLNGDDGTSIKGDKGDTGDSIKGDKGDTGTSVKGDKGDKGDTVVGKDGQSSYELAVEDGFVGTESEYLDSLHGTDGKDGATLEQYQDLLSFQEKAFEYTEDVAAGGIAVANIDFNPDHKGHSFGWGLGIAHSFNGYSSVAGSLGYQYGFDYADADVSFVVKGWMVNNDSYALGMGGVIGF